MDYTSVLETITQTALNYIFVSSITAGQQARTVSDMKTDLRTTKEDLMSELKDSRENLLQQIELTAKQQEQAQRQQPKL